MVEGNDEFMIVVDKVSLKPYRPQKASSALSEMVGNHMDLMIVIHCPTIGAGMVLDEPLFYSARMDPLVLPENVLNPPNQAPVLFFQQVIAQFKGGLFHYSSGFV